MKKIIRVFPSKTNATPDPAVDANVRVRTPRSTAMPTIFDEADEVHISVAFTWDMELAERLTRQWEYVAPVKLGGPAYNEPGGDFVPGMYMKPGYVITSRGCTNKCWFCAVPQREGGVLRELPITDGWIITDDNLLACSEKHITGVFEMLSRQPHRPQFTGGLEAALLTTGMASRLRTLKPETMFFAYDTPNDLEPLQAAGRMLFDAGFTKASHVLRCYVLCGYKGDTFDKARQRMREVWQAGFLPMAMLYRDQKGDFSKEWKQFQRQWANIVITYCNCIKYFGQ